MKKMTGKYASSQKSLKEYNSDSQDLHSFVLGLTTGDFK
jgi:hypothetical protein